MKPNYVSTMNYLYQHAGLGGADRYYLDHEDCWQHLPCRRGGADCAQWDQDPRSRWLALQDGPLSEAFRLGYSSGTHAALDETALQEAPAGGASPRNFIYVAVFHGGVGSS